MCTKGKIEAVNISEAKGTVKRPVDEIVIDERGIAGDAHAGPWHRQVSLLASERVESFVAETGRATGPGEFAENITTRGIDVGSAAVMDRFRIGSVDLEVTQIGKQCHGAGCEVFQEVGKCIMPTEGVFCRVIAGGRARPGDEIVHHRRVLSVRIITLSDRAAAGEYADRSGPRAQEIIEAFAAEAGWIGRIERAVLPDETDRLAEALRSAVADGVDVVFALGGTGVGPRDITPEAVSAVCEKMLPGIMEHIRVTFGAANPKALLSRSVAGIAGRTQIYALPGSVRAVEEYLGEILKTLEHTVFMMAGLDTH